MAEHTHLRQNAIVRNASVGVSPPHGPVKTGELPLVHVKQPPVGPQVQESQQKPVAILPPNNAEAAVKTGGLPMVKVKMTDGKPKLDDGGVDEKVVIRDSKHSGVSAGGLPMLNIQMTKAGPQLQTLPNIQDGPPQIPSAPPVLSSPRGASAQQGYVAPTPARQGYVARGPLAVSNQFHVARVAAPRPPVVTALPQPTIELPPVPDMTVDQLLYCRHLADKDLAEIRAASVSASIEQPASIESRDVTAQLSDETAQLSESVLARIQLAETMIATIDDILVATAVHAEAAAFAAVAPAPQAAPTIATTASASIALARSVSVAASQSIAPTPSASYVAGRVGGYAAGGGFRAQRNAAMAPRRVARAATSAGPLPMVQVKMDGQRSVVQNQAEIEAAKAAMVAAETLPFAPVPDGSGEAQG